ncbi:hypothetical protein D3C75_711710 [compost metagenome]
MHCNALLIACQRQNGWAFSAWQQRDNLVQTLAWCMQHNVFRFTRLNHALNTSHQFVDKLLFSFWHFAIALNQARFGTVNHFNFTQAVGFKCCTGRNQVTNCISQTRTRGNFNGTVQQARFELHTFAIKVAL